MTTPLASRPSANLAFALAYLDLDIATLAAASGLDWNAVSGIITRRVGDAPGGHWPLASLASAVTLGLEVDASYLYLDIDLDEPAAKLALDGPRARGPLEDRPSINMAMALAHWAKTTAPPEQVGRGRPPEAAARLAVAVWGKGTHAQRINDIIRRRTPGVGRGHWPKPESAEQVCAVLGVDASYLYLPPPRAREMLEAGAAPR